MMKRYGVFNQSDAAGPEQATPDKAVRLFVRDASALRFAERAAVRNRDIVYVVRRLNEPVYRPSREPLGKAWIDLGSDVNWQDHGGVWGRPVKDQPGNWWVICFEPTSDWGDDAESTYGKYYASLAFVDLTAFGSPDELAHALKYADVPADGLDDYGVAIPAPQLAAMTAWALHSYGCREIEGERNGGAAFGILVELAREARGSE